MDDYYWHVESSTGTSFAVSKDIANAIDKAIDNRDGKIVFTDYFDSECRIYRPHQTVVAMWETSRETRRVSRLHDQKIAKEQKEDAPSFD